MARTIDKMMKEEQRSSFADWLLGLPATNGSPVWGRTLADAFDWVFGEDALSFRCFISSAIASVAGVIIIFYAWLVWSDALYLSLLGFYFRLLPVLVVISAIITALPGYLVFLETRMVVRLIASRGKLLELLLLDFVLTFVLAWIVLAPFQAILASDVTSFSRDVLKLSHETHIVGVFQDLHGWPAVALIAGGGPSQQNVPGKSEGSDRTLVTGLPVGIWFYSVFVSSVWVWFAVSAALFSKFTLKLASFSRFVRRHFDYHVYPTTMIAIFLICVLTPTIILVVLISSPES